MHPAFHYTVTARTQAPVPIHVPVPVSVNLPVLVRMLVPVPLSLALPPANLAVRELLGEQVADVKQSNKAQLNKALGKHRSVSASSSESRVHIVCMVYLAYMLRTCRAQAPP